MRGVETMIGIVATGMANVEVRHPNGMTYSFEDASVALGGNMVFVSFRENQVQGFLPDFYMPNKNTNLSVSRGPHRVSFPVEWCSIGWSYFDGESA